MKKIFLTSLYCCLISICSQAHAESLLSTLPSIEMGSHGCGHVDPCRPKPVCPTCPTGPTGPAGPAGPGGVLDFASAFSTQPGGPSGGTGLFQGYPTIDIRNGTTGGNQFIEFPNQFPSTDIVFKELTGANSGTLIMFQTAGTYLIQVSVSAACFDPEFDNVNQPLFLSPDWLLGAFKGSSKGVPNSLPIGNLFLAISNPFNDEEFGQPSGATLTAFFTFQANAFDTLAFGNATNSVVGPSVPTFLLLQQLTYTPPSGPPSTVSNTATVSIIKLN